MCWRRKILGHFPEGFICSAIVRDRHWKRALQYADGDSSEEDPVVSREADGGDEKGQEFVLHWLARVEPPENPSTPPVSFERGVIPGTAMNHLMRLGLVDPLTLVQYTNL
jgi:hypothetical protein